MSLPWFLFFLIIFTILVIDLGVLNKKNKTIGFSESLYRTLIYVIISCIFGASIWYLQGSVAGMQFFSGYFIEQSLSMDNVFIISIIFSYFKIPRPFQHRILFYGILSAIIMRGIMIYLGSALVSSMHWMLYVFGAFLVYTGTKLLFHKDKFSPENNQLIQFIKNRFNISTNSEGQEFILKKEGRWYITTLGITLIIIEVMDLIFALDSIPAIFAITTDYYIVYTSNIFAILGLRSLYFALDHMAGRFYYLRHSLAIILIFIGAKVFIAYFWGEIPIQITLLFTMWCLITAIILSLLHKK